MKHNFTLTPEEQEIEDAINRGDYTSTKNLAAEKRKYEAIAKYTLEKSKVITVRLTEKNLIKVKAAAAREGIPYQTFITSLIHKNT